MSVFVCVEMRYLWDIQHAIKYVNLGLRREVWAREKGVDTQYITEVVDVEKLCFRSE